MSDKTGATSQRDAACIRNELGQVEDAIGQIYDALVAKQTLRLMLSIELNQAREREYV